MLETWRMVWRRSLQPLLTVEGLEALRRGLVEDSAEIAQGVTVEPIPLLGDVPRCPVMACPVAYAEWKGHDIKTAAQVQERFSAVLGEAGRLLEFPSEACAFFDWVDDTPRDEMRRELLIEVQRSLSEKLGATEADRDAADRAGNLLRRA